MHTCILKFGFVTNRDNKNMMWALNYKYPQQNVNWNMKLHPTNDDISHSIFPDLSLISAIN